MKATPSPARRSAPGFVVRELSPVVSNWRAQLSLGDYLKKYGIPGISEVDTRALTKKLRVDGAMKCCLSTTLPIADDEAVRRARAGGTLAGADYVKNVTYEASLTSGAPTIPRTTTPSIFRLAPR